nr:magnesium/cobalt transporter CorA [Robertkochia sp. 3YJGBD-33]
MRKVITKTFRADSKIGKAPGTVIYQGMKGDGKYSVEIITYSEDSYEEKIIDNFNNGIPKTNGDKVCWINVRGLSKEKEIEKLGKSYNLIPLTMEDIVNTNSRPKVDEYPDYIFCIMKMFYLDEDYNEVMEHVSLVLTGNTVLLFQEAEHDVFEGVRDRLRNSYGRIRTRGADYLLFALIDAIIDQYFLISENLLMKIESLEDKIYREANQDTAIEIQRLKKEVLTVRKPIAPVKEMIKRLYNTNNSLVTEDTKVFLTDAMDHSIQIHENIELYREMSVHLMETYMSHMSNRMNEVMKVLTIMATIFIPLTFIVGVYGMNFEYMPELDERYAYFVVWGVMLFIFFALLIYFKRKRWL